jgi:hypothetical protein
MLRTQGEEDVDMTWWKGFIWLAVVVACTDLASAKVIQVGPTRALTRVSYGVAAASDGDIIEIDSGTYITSEGWAWVDKNNLTLRGVGPTRPVMDSWHGAMHEMGIFVVLGNNTTFENLELKDCRLTPAEGANGTGIRIVGAGLTVRNCYIHDCDDGIMGGANANSDILVENCEFDHCGYVNIVTDEPDPQYSGYSHNLYIGNVRSFTIRYTWTHNAVWGHDIKTRAKLNYILYNRITDENGSASYEVNVPNAGTTYIIGNLIQQGPYSENSTIIDYASEGASNPDKHLYVVNNTIINDLGRGTFVRNYTSTAALLQNNIFQGAGTILSGAGTQVANLAPPANAYIRDAAGFDYHLTAQSTAAMNAGAAPGVGVDGFAMTPASQYVHAYKSVSRPADGTIDIGAFEYAPNEPPTVDAGPDVSAYEGQNVQLHAAALDPNYDALTYAWSQMAGLNVALGNGSTADAIFTAPAVASAGQTGMSFQVTVSDAGGKNASDTINVRVYMAGDGTHDDKVDISDLLNLSRAYGSSQGQASYDPQYDFTGDGVIDASDLLSLSQSWGRSLE